MHDPIDATLFPTPAATPTVATPGATTPGATTLVSTTSVTQALVSEALMNEALATQTLVTKQLVSEASMTTPRAAVPRIVARVGVRVRAGTLADVAFIDRLQKAHSRELGFLPTMAIEGKIKLGQVLVAERAAGGGQRAAEDEDAEGTTSASSSEPPAASRQPPALPIGYLIAADRYCRRDELGCVTQINVVADYRRSLVAAELLQAQFDRSAYGCRLYCCWCAQDLKANAFWEAMGFTAIAFRTGSRTKGKTADGKTAPRIHLFWQKRIRADDTGDPARGGTPWWYPAATSGGEMREDRLVFPIPPGVHWRDVLPAVLPETANAAIERRAALGVDDTALRTRPCRPGTTAGKSIDRKTKPVKAGVGGGLWFGGRATAVDRTDDDIAEEKAAKAAAREAARAAAKAQQSKVDPRLTAMARELRDRWAEQSDFILPTIAKHDVRRGMAIEASPMLALPAAA